MTQEYVSPSAVPFDLDEDSVPDTVAIDADADGTADVVGFDLDEDSVLDVVAVDLDADGVADAVARFDLRDYSATDATVVESDQLPPEDAHLEDDSLYTPPDDLTNEDLEQAQGDLEHTDLMGDYMRSTGVIS